MARWKRRETIRSKKIDRGPLRTNAAQEPQHAKPPSTFKPRDDFALPTGGRVRTDRRAREMTCFWNACAVPGTSASQLDRVFTEQYVSAITTSAPAPTSYKYGPPTINHAAFIAENRKIESPLKVNVSASRLPRRSARTFSIKREIRENTHPR